MTPPPPLCRRPTPRAPGGRPSSGAAGVDGGRSEGRDPPFDPSLGRLLPLPGPVVIPGIRLRINISVPITGLDPRTDLDDIADEESSIDSRIDSSGQVDPPVNPPGHVDGPAGIMGQFDPSVHPPGQRGGEMSRGVYRPYLQMVHIHHGARCELHRRVESP